MSLDPGVYERAAQLVEAGWTQRAMARTADGTPTPYDGDEAACHCMQGAVYRAAPAAPRSVQPHPYWAEVIARVKNPVQFNDADGRTAGEVAAELRRVGQEVAQVQS